MTTAHLPVPSSLPFPPTGTLTLLDGTVADRSSPLLRADDLGVLRGDGVFEALLVVHGRPRHLGAHLARLARSAAALDLRAPAETDWSHALGVALARHRPADELYVRLVLTRGPEGAATETGYVLIDDVPENSRRARTKGVRAVTLTRGTALLAPGAAPWLLQGAKTLSYAVNMAAQRWARAQGGDDAIFLASDGTVLEAPTAAVLLATGRRLRSPSPELGILPSTELSALFTAARQAGWECAYTRLTMDDLRGGDGLWLISSIRLCARVRSLDGVSCPPGPYDDEIAALAGVSPVDGRMR